MSVPLDWQHETSEIAERGLKCTREATDVERKALCEALDLLSCTRLSVSYTLQPLAGEAWRLSGSLSADVSQACVVSLEPLSRRVEETIDVEFRRGVTDESDMEEEREALSLRDVEPVDRDGLEVGRIVYETLAAGLDPYPRKEEADFSWTDPKAEEGAAAANPFAVLKKLKRDI